MQTTICTYLDTEMRFWKIPKMNNGFTCLVYKRIEPNNAMLASRSCKGFVPSQSSSTERVKDILFIDFLEGQTALIAAYSVGVLRNVAKKASTKYLGSLTQRVLPRPDTASLRSSPQGQIWWCSSIAGSPFDFFLFVSYPGKYL